MRNIIFLVLIAALFSCKKETAVTDFRIRTQAFYEDSLYYGRVDYEYFPDNKLLKTETFHFNDYFNRHEYEYFNDSVVISEVSKRTADSVRKRITLYTSGNKRLITKIRSFNFNDGSSLEYNYTYDAGGHLINGLSRPDTGEATGFTYADGNATGYYEIVDDIYSPPDTIDSWLTYTTYPYQRGINPVLYLGGFNAGELKIHLLGFDEPSVNFELAGCTFNGSANLIETVSSNWRNIFIVDGSSETFYSYETDNRNRIKLKSYYLAGGMVPLGNFIVHYYYFDE